MKFTPSYKWRKYYGTAYPAATGPNGMEISKLENTDIKSIDTGGQYFEEVERVVTEYPELATKRRRLLGWRTTEWEGGKKPVDYRANIIRINTGGDNYVEYVIGELVKLDDSVWEDKT